MSTHANPPRAVLAATGLFTPPSSIDNEELVESFNAWVDAWNAAHADAITSGEIEAKAHSSAAFIEKASGIRARFVMDKAGVLDVERMAPRLAPRPNEELSILAEMAVHAARDALHRGGRTAADVGAVVVACSNLQRAYPAIAVEVQSALGITGFGFDMNVACSSATFGVQVAKDLIEAGSVESVLVVNPEICTAHLNFTDRDSHFIFGDVATAMLLERGDRPAAGRGGFEILGTRLATVYSNNIRNNFGFLNRAEADDVAALADRMSAPDTDLLFKQEGRKVFKEVVPMVSDQILAHLAELGLEPAALKRLWLHQANLSMNRLIAKRVLGRDAEELESPTILDRYANTSSAGSVIALHLHHEDLAPGDVGLLCSFGAGYSAGTVLLRRR
ncbi:MAG: beta-ketoacyl-ACP synthase III [Sandaracinaceae bacterium]|nr:beta-ketoacyl-ACP synthase III [Sandaracinaceae bacterium]